MPDRQYNRVRAVYNHLVFERNGIFSRPPEPPDDQSELSNARVTIFRDLGVQDQRRAREVGPSFVCCRRSHIPAYNVREMTAVAKLCVHARKFVLCLMSVHTKTLRRELTCRGVSPIIASLSILSPNSIRISPTRSWSCCAAVCIRVQPACKPQCQKHIC